MRGRSYQTGKYYGHIWYRNSLGGTPITGPHPRFNMRRILPWLEKKIKGKGINPNPKEILVRKARRKTCQILNDFTIMSWDIMP